MSIDSNTVANPEVKIDSSSAYGNSRLHGLVSESIVPLLMQTHGSPAKKPAGCQVSLLNARDRISVAFGLADSQKTDLLLTPQHVFDIGGLTKLVVTLPVTLRLAQKGLVKLDQRVSAILQSFGVAGKESMTVRHLLRCTSGYGEFSNLRRLAFRGTPTLQGLPTRRAALLGVMKEVSKQRLTHMPGKVRTDAVSAWLILGEILETVTGKPLDRLFLEEVVKPLRLRSSAFIDLELIRKGTLSQDDSIIVPSYGCEWRGRRLQGEASDEIAWLLSGVSPHGGLFSTADEVATVLAHMCFGGTFPLHDGSRYLTEEFQAELLGTPSELPFVFKKETDEKHAPLHMYRSGLGHVVCVDSEKAAIAVCLASGSHAKDTAGKFAAPLKQIVHGL